MLPLNEQYALFIDIDGTLMRADFVVPDRNIKALSKARELGHKVFLNTGRSKSNIPAEIISQVESDGIISGDGTLVEYHGEQYEGALFTPELYLKIAEYAFAHPEVHCIIEGINWCYSINGGLSPVFPREVRVRNTAELIERIGDDKIQVIAISNNVGDDFKAEMTPLIEFFAFSDYYDMVVKGMNKVEGIRHMLEITGISPENTMAFGDSENDRTMLEYCSIGVAMGNAQPGLKKIADYVSCSNVEGGVGEAVEKYLLNY